MTRQIEVWLDNTTDYDSPRWCVSLCEMDGSEVSCLSAHEDRHDAFAAASRAAAKQGLRVYTRSQSGQLALV